MVYIHLNDWLLRNNNLENGFDVCYGLGFLCAKKKQKNTEKFKTKLQQVFLLHEIDKKKCSCTL